MAWTVAGDQRHRALTLLARSRPPRASAAPAASFKSASVHQRSVAHELTFRSVASQTSDDLAMRPGAGMPSTAARSRCHHGDKHSHARPILSVIQAPSAQFLDEQLPDQQRTSPPSPAPGPTARSRSSKLSSSAAARNPAAGVLLVRPLRSPYVNRNHGHPLW